MKVRFLTFSRKIEKTKPQMVFKFIMALVALPIALFVFGNTQSDEFIRRKSEDLVAGIEVVVGDEKIYCLNLLPEFYQRRKFQRAWDEKDKRELLEILKDADSEGLNASDYHFEAIKKVNKRSLSTIEKSELDLLLTDAFLLYASHFLNGKLNPETVDSEWRAIRREGNAREFLEGALAKDQIKENLQALEPTHQGYAGLKRMLAKYNQIKQNGGWNSIPPGETIRPGLIDSIRVPLLISRLVATRDLAERPEDENLYSEKISQALKSYQERNGLEADGNLGKMTTATLNVSVDERINQIRINMERYRWISQNLGVHYVMVNIADFQLEVYKNNKLKFQEKVIVGKPFRKTPVFSSKMTYLVFNPTWTIPPTILFNDILPEVKKNYNYLKEKNIRVIQGQGSQAVFLDPATIDWSALSKSNFPYILRQDPGKTNALGVVKFMFPNSYNVYIHDTPSKELFNRSDRAFSSGCIRLNNPLAFANYLLKDNANWNEDQINKIISTTLEKSVTFEKPINVHILYLTSWTLDGKIQFRNDLYDRDQPVLQALNQKPPSI